MAMFKDVEYTVPSDDNGKITIEQVVQAFVDDKIGELAQVIAWDNEGLVFEWKTELSPEEEATERERIRAEEQAKADAEADDRKLGF